MFRPGGKLFRVIMKVLQLKLIRFIYHQTILQKSIDCTLGVYVTIIYKEMIEMTVPNKPKSSRQRYRKVKHEINI